MARPVVRCFLAVALLILPVLGQEMKLELAQVVFRHGDRSAVDTFPSNTCDESCWPQGFGQLSQRGMRQHYILGQYLRGVYRNFTGFLNSTYYIQNQIYIRSTDVDRTLMSVESQLSSFFPPEGFQKFEEDLPWQPIPVHTVPKHHDSLLRAYDTADNMCPRYTEIYNEQDQYQYYKDMTAKYQDFLKWIQVQSKVDYEVTLMNIYKIHDPLFCQREHNLSLPTWANSSVMQTLKTLADFGMMAMFHGNEAHRLTAGLLVADLLGHMVNKSNNPGSTDKVYLYSAHDTTVAALLNALGLSNGLQPPYASAVMIELYSDQEQKYYVKILYRNETADVSSMPYDLTSDYPGCEGKSPCPLETFKVKADTVIPSDWSKECGISNGNSSSTKETKTIVIAGFSIGGLLIVVLFVVVVVLCRRQMRTGYENLDVKV